jgi:hypothetical protein
MSLSAGVSFIDSLYFLMVCLLHMAHPVSGLVASWFVRCS